MGRTNDDAVAAELEQFHEHWGDYVCELSGICDRREAEQSYLSEREWLLKRLFAGGEATLFRTVVLAEDEVGEGLRGGPRDLGIFWTSDKTMAMHWWPGSCYSDSHVIPTGQVCRVFLKSVIRLEDIDLVSTIGCRLGSSWEGEIRLKEGTKVCVEEFEILDSYFISPPLVMSP